MNVLDAGRQADSRGRAKSSCAKHQGRPSSDWGEKHTHQNSNNTLLFVYQQALLELWLTAIILISYKYRNCNIVQKSAGCFFNQDSSAKQAFVDWENDTRWLVQRKMGTMIAEMAELKKANGTLMHETVHEIGRMSDEIEALKTVNTAMFGETNQLKAALQEVKESEAFWREDSNGLWELVETLNEQIYKAEDAHLSNWGKHYAKHYWYIILMYFSQSLVIVLPWNICTNILGRLIQSTKSTSLWAI